ncbi:pyridoxamine 5'-phosphate oxidase family protein [Nocardia sp. NPDC101769]|uniref:pyridoxamine 5'-phosphate oxidase family protein n=1 Tax=Nocardia sp. NPDC101769 TaxID=3364333 RepID=UPI003823E677
MATWREFEHATPELAAAVRARFEATKHHVLATIRRDGAPRVSGTEVEFTDKDLKFGSMADAVKVRDLQRDGRCALHANPGDGSMDGGDGKVSGVAVEIPVREGNSFRLDIREAVHTTVDGDELVIRWWTPNNGLREIRRK